MASQPLHPRDSMVATMQRIYRRRMTTTSGGNLSLRDADSDVWITPARIDKGKLVSDDIVRVRPDGSLDGRHPPSSELPFHQAVYRARPDLGGIVHAHPVGLVAFSISKRAPDTRLFHQARRICGEVGFAPYALPGSPDLGERVAAEFARGRDAVVLENHGVVVGGATLHQAFERFETLEFTAQTALRARDLGEPRSLSDDEIELAAKDFREFEEFDALQPDSREREVREQLCEFVHRGYERGLMTSTEGTFSARLDDDRFLVTPTAADRAMLRPDEIALVDGGRCQRGIHPSRASRVHRSLYRAHPEIGAIVNAYAVHASAFSVTGRAVDSRTIPESYIILRDVGLVPYGAQFDDALLRHISPERPVAIVENDGMMALGATVLEAFDRLEVLEATAEALIHTHALGAVSPMPDTAIAELRRVFLQSS